MSLSREEIVRMAITAGIDELICRAYMVSFERLANAAYAAGAAAEREACAVVCELMDVPEKVHGAHPHYLVGQAMGNVKCAVAIRARGNGSERRTDE